MKTKNIFFILASLIFFWWQQVSAQPIQPQFQHLTVDDGLSDFLTSAVVQDQDGFIWIATRNGLDRFDGYSVKSYFHEPVDSTSLSNNVVTTVFVDHSGKIWAGCIAGLSVYDKQFDCFQQIDLKENEVRNQRLIYICEAQDQGIWLGTSAGLKRWDPKEKKIENVPFLRDSAGKLVQGIVTEITADEDSNLWITGKFGVVRFNTIARKSYIIKSDSKKFDVAKVQRVAVDDGGKVWMITSTGILAQVKDDVVRNVFDLEQWIPEKNQGMRKLIADHYGNFWIAVFYGGLVHFNPGRNEGQFIPADPLDARGLRSNQVTNLFLDRQNILWINYDGGLSRFALDAKPFYSFSQKYFPTETTLAGNWVRCFEEDNSGNIWIGTVNGISIFNKSTGKFLRNIFADTIHHTTIPYNSVRAMNKDAVGNIWIGTAGGIARYNISSGDFTATKIIPGHHCFANPNFIMGISCNTDGAVYAVSNCGFYQYDPSQNAFTTFDNDSLLSIMNYQTSMRSLFKDREGNFWMSSDFRGVLKWNPSTHTLQSFPADYNRKDWLWADVIDAFNEDQEGNIWMTSRNGLFCYHPSTNTFQNLSMKDGLPNNFCGSILIDDCQRIWFTNGAGLTCYNPADKTFHTYNKSDGLQGSQFNDQQGFISRDGYFFLGGREGFSFFYPDSIHENKIAPTVLLQSLKIMDKEYIRNYSRVDSLSFILPHDQNFISFKMAAINFDHPEKNQYAYYLEGLETRWNYTGTNRIGNYTGLLPGKYVLHIKTSNADGVWNEKAFSIPIIINLPYWQTWWFGTLFLLTITGILYALYRYRLNHILKLQRVRNRIARDLHDDVGASLSSIRMYSEAIRSQVKEKIPLADIILQKISENSKEVVENMSDIVWAINPKNDSLQSMEDRMRSFAIEICAPKNISLQFDFTENGTLKIPMELRKNIFLIFKEAMNNATKYSGCTGILIKLHHASQNLEMEIVDDGKGFDEEKIKRGNGLLNMGKRAEEIRGKMTIQSEEGKGTTIRLVAHLP